MRKPLPEEQGRHEGERGHREEFHIQSVRGSLPAICHELCCMINYDERDGGDLIYLEIGCALLQGIGISTVRNLSHG